MKEKSKVVPLKDLYGMEKNHRIVGNYEDEPVERSLLLRIVEKILIATGLVGWVYILVWLALKIIG